MKKLILISSLLLAACSPIDPLERARQDQACEDKGGVYRYAILDPVTCRNGQSVKFSYSILKEKYYPKDQITIE